MRAAAFAAVLLLAGCATPRERIVYQSVTVPVFQPCKPTLGPKPIRSLPVTDDIFAQMAAALSYIAASLAWETELEAAVSGCAGE